MQTTNVKDVAITIQIQKDTQPVEFGHQLDEDKEALSYENRLFILHLLSLEYRRLRDDMIQVYKVAHIYYDEISVKKKTFLSLKMIADLEVMI